MQNFMSSGCTGVEKLQVKYDAGRFSTAMRLPSSALVEKRT